MIVIERLNSRIDKFRSYSIYIDGKKYGRIKNNSQITIECSPGIHTIYLVVDWCKSQKLGIDVREEVKLVCFPKNSGKIFLSNIFTSVIHPNDYITLEYK